MTEFVEIAVSIPQAQGVFDYHLPPELANQVMVGQLVSVPFGKQTVHGVVLRHIDQPSVKETRPVLSIVDPAAVLTKTQLALAHQLAKQTLSPLSACIGLMLPPGLAQHADSLYSERVEGTNQPLTGLSTIQQQILKLLKKRGPLRGSQIEHAISHSDWRPAMRELVRRGYVVTTSILPPPKVKPKFVRTAQLACPPEQAEQAMASLGRAGSPALLRRQTILHFLMREAGPVEVTWLYAESSGNLQDLYYLAERELIALGESELWRDPLSQIDYQPAQAPVLTNDQQHVWDILERSFKQVAAGVTTPPALLHGVTGSGKTEIYLQAVGETLRLGKQAIILVPEIALTPQTVRRFVSRYPGQVGLFHSRLSLGERYDTWRRARSGSLHVLIGARSALFTPFPNLGLIVVDECHDESYYQSDPQPYYHASQIACNYARLAGAVCLLGSATPDVTMNYQADQGDFQYLHLPARILAHRQVIRQQIESAHLPSSHYRALEYEADTIDLPPVQVVDMRQELQAGNRSIFSQRLQQALSQVLEQNQQAILFLNRRGSATYIFCRDCGFTLECPRCNLPLTYHIEQSMDNLRCHYCGYQRKSIQKCPECGSAQIRHYGAGTERVESELLKLFPQVRVLRWDYETTRQKGSHEVILGHFIAHRADVLIGTQMIAKGLDLPLVTLVGVVLADVGLNMPDYRSAERTFQVLTQVAGRAGRSPLGGQVIMQTFQPSHYAIQAAALHSYRDFYQRELEHRRRLGYPPFGKLVRMEVQLSDARQAESAATRLAIEIREWMAEVGDRSSEIIGPAPCFFERLSGLFRWQIILRGPDPVGLLKGRQLAGWKVEVNPPNLL